MGSITTGIGLISGIDIASLIDSLITLESRGKFRLQARVAILQSQQTAILDVNARLLAFKSAAGSFRLNKTFQSVTATSSDAEVLTASASTGASPGSFDFIVKQLVATSQQLSRGYATSDESPLGLDQISFELGNGRLARDLALEDLNGGAGVDRGRIVIDDGDGGVATIDLTDVTTVNEVLDRINGTTDVDVTATVVDDHLYITDNNLTNEMTISNGVGDTTATDLGIATTSVGNNIVGSSIYYVGGNTALRALNDGNNVLVRNNTADLRITARDGTVIDVDLGRIDLDIDDTTELSELNNGAGITIDDDNDTKEIKFIARDGTEFEVNLTGVTTVGQLRTRISSETEGHITLDVVNGDHFRVTDNLSPGGPQNLRIQGTDDNGTDAAEDLGILNETGVATDTYEGSVVPSTIDQPAATTVQEIIDRINTAPLNTGKVVASINADGLRLQLDDRTFSTMSNLIVASTASNTTAAGSLGLEQSVAGDTITGERILGGLDSVLSKSLNGGSGLTAATAVTFDDRAGNGFTFFNVDTFENLSDLVTAINTDAMINGVQISVSLNDTQNGLKVTDTSGMTVSNLTISALDDTAQLLGIEADVAANTVIGNNLQLQYVDSGTKLADMNYGRGISTGSFRITDGLGQSATVNIGGSEDTAQDVIDEINSRGIAVLARINDNGDGIIIEEDPVALGGQSPFVKIKVEATGGGTARELNLVGEADDLNGGFIDGSYEHVVDLNTSDSLDDVVSKINDAGIPVNASVINTGAGGSPYRLNVTSGISGQAGDLVIDTGGVDTGFSVLSRGQDAKVFFGASDPEDAFLLRSATNSLDGVIDGVTIDLHAVSDEPVTVTIARDDGAIVAGVTNMVTAFNEVIGTIKSYDFYDVDTEERGLLLGNPTASRVRSSLYRVASGSALNVSGQYQYLSQVGIKFNGEGQMSFDPVAFQAAYASDPEGVEELIAAYDVTLGGTTEVVAGVTIDSTETTFNSLGFGNLFDNLLDDLTNSIDGVTTRAESAFESQIDLLNDRIETLDERLLVRRAQLLRQFTAMETALARLQSQSNALASLAGNVALASLRINGTG